ERAQGKEGVATGCHAIHPLTGEKVPIHVASFVLMGYGTGAVMAVPAHDQRDFEFAEAHGIGRRVVVVPDGRALDASQMTSAFEDDGVLQASGEYTGLSSAEARARIAEQLELAGKGRREVHYRLRDWGISRQRYWGTPIPVIHCDACGVVPVPEKDLPVVLPEDCVPDGSGNPLRKRADFVDVACPKCGKAAKRETDTMDTFVDSS